MFAGWIVHRAATREEFGETTAVLYGPWRFLLRYLCPIAVGAVLLASMT